MSRHWFYAGDPRALGLEHLYRPLEVKKQWRTDQPIQVGLQGIVCSITRQCLLSMDVPYNSSMVSVALLCSTPEPTSDPDGLCSHVPPTQW